MKIDKTTFVKYLSKLSDVMPPKTMEECQGVLVKNGKLIASNLLLTVGVDLGYETDETFIIPPAAISMLSKLPEGDVELRVIDSSKLEIRSGAIKSTLSMGRHEAYPVQGLTIEQEGNALVMDGEKLNNCIRSVLYAVSKNEIKPIFTGVLFEAAEGTLNMVSCDGYRLAWQVSEAESNFKFVLPENAAKKVLSFSLDDEVTIYHTNKSAVFKCGEVTIETRLLEGEFLNYSGTVPKHELEFSVDSQNILNALSRCLVFFDSKRKSPAELRFSGRKLTMYIKTSTSEYEEEIDMEGDCEENLVIGANVIYLHEAIKNLNGDKIVIGVKNALSPMTFRDESTTAMVLPIRLRDN